MELKKREIAARLGQLRKRVREKSGHWKWAYSEGETAWTCSECGYKHVSESYPLQDRMNYCPACGTMMADKQCIQDDDVPFYDSEAEV